MATLRNKKEEDREMRGRGARRSSSSLITEKKKVENEKGSLGEKNAFYTQMKNNREQSIKKNTTDLKRENNTIKAYEAIPDYNVLERLTDTNKMNAYNRKQSMLPEYKEAKNRVVGNFLEKNNISDSDLAALSSGTYGNKAIAGLDLLNAYMNRDKKSEALEKLKNAEIRDISASDILEYAQEQSRKKDVQDLSKFTDEHKVLGTAMTLPLNMAGGLQGTVGNVGNYLAGKPIDSDSFANHYSNLSNEMRNAASDDMGKVGKLLYGVGTSIGDSGLSLAMSGGNPAVSALLQGTQAFNNSAIDAAKRGLNPNQIMATSAVSGAAETMLEKLSLDNLKGIVKNDVSKEAGKSVFKSILGQMKTEAGEEMATEVVNEVADRFINKDLSNFVQSVEQYQLNGMSEQEAKAQAWKDLGGQIAYAGAAGAISGGVMGGGAAAVNALRNNTEVPYLREDVKKAETEADPISELKKLDPLNALGMNDVSDNVTETDAYKRERKQSIVNQISDIFKGNVRPDTLVQIGATPAILKKYGASDLNMNMSQNTMFKIAYPEGYNGGKHNLGFDAVTELPYQLSDPIAILKSDTEKNSFVVVTEYIDEHNYPIITAIHLNKNGVIEPANQIASMYGKRDFAKWVEGQKEKGNVLYEKQNKGLDSVALAGLQLPSLYSESDPLFINSIPTSAENVNGSAENAQQPISVDSAAVQRIAEMRAAMNEQSGNQRVRGYNDTLINKTDAPQELKNEFIENPDIYTQLSNKETAAKADAILASGDINSAIAQYHSLLDNKNPIAVPLGYNISKQLAQSGRLDDSVQIVREMSRALTESGQFSQAAAITMLNNDPEAAKRYLIREIDTMNQKGREKYGKKWTDFELTESELQQFANIQSGDTDAIKAVYENVYSRLRKQYPSTMTEKFMELRRVSMLLNVRTNVRNYVSNALLYPVRWTADRVSALGEGVYSLINPKYQRTQSMNPIRSKQTRKLASEAFETVRSELLGDNKYDDAKDAMRDKQVFKGGRTARMLDTITNGAITKANQAMGKDVNPSLLETARNFTYYLLQKGDDVFVKKNFESRMASYLAAQGITDLESIPADAYVLATQEALKATFKDDSKFAKQLSGFRQLLNEMPGHFVGEAIMPFTKTPANLAMRGIDYSPAGVFNVVKTLKNAKNNVDIAKGLTQLGQAATGTAAIALGYVLAEAGILKGALSEDKDEAQFQKQQGELAYSIKIGDKYLTYDWAQPASIPLILGVTLHDSWNDENDFIHGVKSGFLAAVDSWLELSPLQNLSDIFGGYGTPAENVWDVLSTDLPLSFLPAQMGAAAKVKDTTQRVTYDQTSYLNNLANQAKAKIPGLSETLPVAYDTWGNPIQRQDSTSEAAFANLLNPGQFGNANVSPIDGEISALYESTNDASVFPRKAAWTENGVKLNNEQYSEFQRIMGENAYDMASAFINSADYESMDDELKVKAIGEMYSFANAMTKSEVTGYDIEGSQSYKKAYSVFKEKGAEGVATYCAITANKDGQSNASLLKAVDALDISNEDRGYYLTVMLGDLSKEATEAYNTGGYEAVYDLYKQKTAVERIKLIREQAAIERIRALRSQV